jgi:hypothetical protein
VLQSGVCQSRRLTDCVTRASQAVWHCPRSPRLVSLGSFHRKQVNLVALVAAVPLVADRMSGDRAALDVVEDHAAFQGDADRRTNRLPDSSVGCAETAGGRESVRRRSSSRGRSASTLCYPSSALSSAERGSLPIVGHRRPIADSLVILNDRPTRRVAAWAAGRTRTRSPRRCRRTPTPGHVDRGACFCHQLRIGARALRILVQRAHIQVGGVPSR